MTRGAVLELARRAGFPTLETAIALHDVYNADECFLTGTGAEVVPVVALDGREIADGKPGPITARLLADYRKLRVSDGARVPYRVTPREAPKRTQAARRAPFPRRTAAP